MKWRSARTLQLLEQIEEMDGLSMYCRPPSSRHRVTYLMTPPSMNGMPFA